MPNPKYSNDPPPDLFDWPYPTIRTLYAPANPTKYHPKDHYGKNIPIVALIFHTPEEDVDDIEVTPWWFQHPDARGSTHYYADSDSDLIQMVAEADNAWAQGGKSPDVSGKNRPAPVWWRSTYRSFNACCLSIEIEGWAKSINETMARGGPQWRTVVRWAAYQCAKHTIRIDRDHLMGHSELPNQSHTDPNFTPATWKALLDDIRKEHAKLQAPKNQHTHKVFGTWQTGPAIS